MSQSASTVNQTLTNYARGIAQDASKCLADFIAPRTVVAQSSGLFKSFSDKNAFQKYKTDRAIGGPATRIEFEADDKRYACTAHALEIAIDDAEQDAAGWDDPLNLRQAKTQTLVSAALTSHEAKVFATLAKNVGAVSGMGDWSDNAVDPVLEIDELIEQIAAASGMFPNRMVFGLGAWAKFRANEKVIARQPGAALVGLNLKDACGLFLNPAIEARVGVISADANKHGKPSANSTIAGDEVYLFHASEMPTPFDPSFAKTFTTGRGCINAVKQYRDETISSDVLKVEWSEDIQVVSPLLIKRVSVS